MWLPTVLDATPLTAPEISETRSGGLKMTQKQVELTPREMSKIHAACFPDRPWKAEEFESLMEQKGVFWGVDQEKRGFILARKAATEAEIITVAVDPAHQRKGIGTELVVNVMHACPMLEARHLFLEVAADNEAASNLYERLGFIEVGRRAGYYARGEEAPVDAVVMGRAVVSPRMN
jgi:ribosomal-protein-alanine N-acetyltransferase